MTHLACRGCGATGLDVVLDFGMMPLANGLLTQEQLEHPEDRFPLALAFCQRCFLAQITHAVPPERLFRDYAYYSSVSDAMVAHAGKLVEHIAVVRALGPKSLVIELASNDGYLLQHYVSRGIPVLGIDPAREIAEAASARGVPTLPEFFGTSLAEELRSSGRMADVIHANNVLAHVPDLHGFLAGIATILKPGGVAVIETPYVRELVDHLEFDTIYHEHVFYYSLSALAELVRPHGLQVIDVEALAIHGGSLRVTFAHEGSGVVAPSVSDLLTEEERIGLRSIDYFRGFADGVKTLGETIRATLAGLKGDGSSIAAYGAGAKGAVLLNAFGIGVETIDFVADRSPYKAGLYMPGVHIPILPAENLLKALPDACLLLTWNFADEILAQQTAYREAGGRFLIPIPAARWT